MPAEDSFKGTKPDLLSPLTKSEVVVPHDTDEQSFVCRAIYVGVEGDVAGVMPDDTVVIFKNMAQGVIHPIRLKRVNATNTTATNLVFLQ